MTKKYEWTRFFCKSNEDAVLVDDAYLYDPQEGEGLVNSHVILLKDIESIPCIVILGEPGMGKSIALEDENERLSQINNSGTLTPVLKKMEEFREGGDLRKVIFESEKWLRWKRGNEKITLLLDSLDEVRINIDTVCSILTEEFKEVDKKRLRLNICCRSGHWPDYFGEELRKLWGKNHVAIFKILPLRACDVEKAVQETDGIDSSHFMSEVKNKGVQTFAAKPITLKPMIEEFASKKLLPGTQWEIYEKLCLKLCDEPNPRYKETPSLKQSYNLDKNQRMGVASKIAAVMMLCSRKLVYLEEKSDSSSKNILFFEDVCTTEEKRGLIHKTDFEETVGKTSMSPL